MNVPSIVHGENPRDHLAEPGWVGQIRQLLTEFLASNTPERAQFVAEVETFLQSSQILWEKGVKFGVTEIDLANLKVLSTDKKSVLDPWQAKQLVDHLLLRFGKDKSFYVALQRCLPANESRARILVQLIRLQRIDIERSGS